MTYPGLYRAVCTAVEPSPGLRIKVRVPQLLGDAALEDWAAACVPPGWKNGLVKPHANHVFTDNDTASGSASETLVHTNNTAPAGASPGGHVQHQLTPKVGEGCWVMFEGGNVNFPVWVGVF